MVGALNMCNTMTLSDLHVIKLNTANLPGTPISKYLLLKSPAKTTDSEQNSVATEQDAVKTGLTCKISHCLFELKQTNCYNSNYCLFFKFLTPFMVLLHPKKLLEQHYKFVPKNHVMTQSQDQARPEKVLAQYLIPRESSCTPPPFSGNLELALTTCFLPFPKIQILYRPPGRSTRQTSPSKKGNKGPSNLVGMDFRKVHYSEVQCFYKSGHCIPMQPTPNSEYFIVHNLRRDSTAKYA